MSATEVTVVIPWAGDCPHRLSALVWLLSRYAQHCPDWRVHVAEGEPEPWCKAKAVMPAVERAQTEIIVVSDADVFCSGVYRAVDAVSAGAAWALPHDRVVRLDPDATDRLLASGIPGTTYDQAPYAPIPGGGLLVARRDVLLDVPLDPRFTGWGQEDESWGHALRCLHGEPWRGRADLIHLWHPPQERTTDRIGSDEGWQLRRRYFRARADQHAMRALLKEVR